MTRRFITALIMCGAACASVAACDDGRWGYYGYHDGRYRPYTCGQYSSCGSCTPVLGCGWCSYAGGGACLSDPDECGAATFTWTWESSGCGASGRDGGISRDSGADGGGTTGMTDAAMPADSGADAAGDARSSR